MANEKAKALKEKTALFEGIYKKKASKHNVVKVIFLVLSIIFIVFGTITFAVSISTVALAAIATIGITIANIGLILFFVFLPLTIVGVSGKKKAKRLIENGSLHEFCEAKAYKIVYGVDKPVVVKKQPVATSKNGTPVSIAKIDQLKGGLISKCANTIVESFLTNKTEVRMTVPSGLSVMFTRHKTVYADGINTYEVIQKSIIFGIFSRKPTLITKNGKELFSIYTRCLLVRLFARHDTLYKNSDKVCYRITDPSIIATIFCNTKSTIKDEIKNREKTIRRDKRIFSIFVKKNTIVEK